MSTIPNYGYGIPKQAGPRGGWTVAYGYGNFVFSTLVMKVQTLVVTPTGLVSSISPVTQSVEVSQSLISVEKVLVSTTSVKTPTEMTPKMTPVVTSIRGGQSIVSRETSPDEDTTVSNPITSSTEAIPSTETKVEAEPDT